MLWVLPAPGSGVSDGFIPHVAQGCVNDGYLSGRDTARSTAASVVFVFAAGS